MMRTFSKIFTFLFHPLLAPLYGTLFYFRVTPKYSPLEMQSGNVPARDELRQMYQWARPRIAVPVHGERRHIIEHMKLAKELQVAEAVAPNNGDLIRLAPGPAAVIDEVLQGRVQSSGDKIRIDAQLVDARSNAQLWVEVFEGNGSNLFALQDQVTG